ncbi:ThiF family adenylyltransferase [Methylococcus mesophilus]|uniref:ThiF family adenylyltransferase n=1 Tax=Methylococcus mesophilus TaxID=2993564 RepID=UPI00224AAB57|nr:ThiF family adenylyltransferase [Methylococcus mesophilus]UZR27795.1 ThiF family adenylyltransferase [Methylococcus mesophilus]
MSRQLINRSPDLKRLRDEGYEVELRSNHLLVHSVPYVNARCEIARGTLVSDLTLAGEVTTRPGNHIAYFIGDHPCRVDGVEIPQIKHGSSVTALAPDITVSHSFSNKPSSGYQDYYEKMIRYIEIIVAHAVSIDPSVTARTFRVIESLEEDSPFVYLDTASSRAGIGALSERLAAPKVAIVGLGGTGSYVLDLLAKTPVREIHLFDGDLFLQHNAFRSPGAAPLDVLKHQPSKVAYFRDVYSKMHRGIVVHEGYVSEADVQELQGFDFVFLCIDKGSVKKPIIEGLQASSTPFIDVGMGIHVVEGSGELLGVCRVTTSSEAKMDHVSRRISFSEEQLDDAYARNIQIADLNALNAALAVMTCSPI